MTGAPPSIHLFSAGGGAPRTLQPPVGFGISSVAYIGTGDEVVYALGETPAGGVGGSAGGNSYVIRQNVFTGEYQRLFWNPYGSQLMEVAGAGRLVFDSRSRQESLRETTINGNPSARGHWLSRGNHAPTPSRLTRPDGEWITFSSNRSGNLDVWALQARSGAVRRVTDNKAEDWDPAFIDGGRSILWSSNRTGNFEIWTSLPDGSNARQVTHDGVDAENPSATPDGSGSSTPRATQRGSASGRSAPMERTSGSLYPAPQYSRKRRPTASMRPT